MAAGSPKAPGYSNRNWGCNTSNSPYSGGEGPSWGSWIGSTPGWHVWGWGLTFRPSGTTLEIGGHLGGGGYDANGRTGVILDGSGSGNGARRRLWLHWLGGRSPKHHLRPCATHQTVSAAALSVSAAAPTIALAAASAISSAAIAAFATAAGPSILHQHHRRRRRRQAPPSVYRVASSFRARRPTSTMAARFGLTRRFTTAVSGGTERKTSAFFSAASVVKLEMVRSGTTASCPLRRGASSVPLPTHRLCFDSCQTAALRLAVSPPPSRRCLLRSRHGPRL